jgi:thiol:disulfide interchange protein DsbD
MKKIILLILLGLSFVGYSQILDPVDWEFDTQKINDDEYELIFMAHLDENWEVYSQFVDDGGPIATSFSFDESEGFLRIAGVIELEENKEVKHDPIFDMIVGKFHTKATFKQRIKIVSDVALIKGSLEFQANLGFQITF